ncbi:MAG: hypothetical protein V4489_08915, partial [Chlamydiota bacterium]
GEDFFKRRSRGSSHKTTFCNLNILNLILSILINQVFQKKIQIYILRHMKAFIDSKLLRKITSSLNENFLLESCKGAGILSPNESIEVIFSWTSLLEYIGLGTLFETFPKFDEKSPLFSCLTSHLDLQSDIIVELYDQIFIECLTQIKSIPEINPVFLLQQIRKKKSPLFNSALSHYDELLTKNPYNAIHDLILYLSFDRVCVYVTALFEHMPSQIKRLEILKECLIESFIHITKDGRTSPGFFRLTEALYAYRMREEHLQSYSDPEWLILCQSVSALKSREALMDVFYIDYALNEENEPSIVFTMDSPDIVKSRLNLVKYILEVHNLKYALLPPEIFHVKEYESSVMTSRILFS